MWMDEWVNVPGRARARQGTPAVGQLIRIFTSTTLA